MPENAKKVRLDKFLTQAAELTRSEAKQKIKKGSVTVNEELIKKPEVKISCRIVYALMEKRSYMNSTVILCCINQQE